MNENDSDTCYPPRDSLLAVVAVVLELVVVLVTVTLAFVVVMMMPVVVKFRDRCRRARALFQRKLDHSLKSNERMLTRVVMVGAVGIVVFTVVDVVLLLLVSQILKRQ